MAKSTVLMFNKCNVDNYDFSLGRATNLLCKCVSIADGETIIKATGKDLLGVTLYKRQRGDNETETFSSYRPTCFIHRHKVNPIVLVDNNETNRIDITVATNGSSRGSRYEVKVKLEKETDAEIERKEKYKRWRRLYGEYS